MTTDAAVRRDVIFPPQDLQSLGELAHFVKTHREPAGLVGRNGERVLLPPRSTGSWFRWWRPCAVARRSAWHRPPSD